MEPREHKDNRDNNIKTLRSSYSYGNISLVSSEDLLV